MTRNAERRLNQKKLTMKRITPGHLQLLVNKIGEQTNIPTGREQAKREGQPNFLYLEYAKEYGGYRLVKVRVDNGGHSGAFNGTASEPRRPAKEMEAFLYGLLTGLTYSKG